MRPIALPVEGVEPAHGGSRPQTLDDGEQDDDDEEEEGDVEDHPVNLVVVPRGVLDLIPDTTARSHAHVHVEQVALWGGLIVNP